MSSVGQGDEEASPLVASGAPKAARVGRFALGLCLLGCVVAIWVASSQLIQYIFDSGDGFDKPFALTYFSTALFTLYLGGFAVSPRWRIGARRALADVRANGSWTVLVRGHVLHGGRCDRLDSIDLCEDPDR
jgi:hypothetical protein